MTKISSAFFHTLSCILNDTAIDWSLFNNFSSTDWVKFYSLSKKQGIVAIIFEKLKDITKEYAPPKEIIIKWLSHTVSIEEQMKAKEAVAIDFANKLSERNIPILVLKGMSYASYYPNPYHRESGDLDCYLLGQKDEGDKSVLEMGGRLEEAGYKHSHLYYKGLIIENHRYLTSFDSSKQGIKTERLLQSLLAGDYKPIGDTKLMNPCADFNAMFLNKHAQRHFIKEGIRIRHLLDWAFFLKSESAYVNWDKVVPMMSECRILNFAKVMTSLCVEQLGMTIDIEGLSGSMRISNIVLADILGDQPDLFHENFIQKIGRIIRRFCRMWKFRSLADESYFRLVWNSIAFSSYLNRSPKL